MYIVPKQVNVSIVPSQITPGAVVAAIFKNGAISEIKRHIAFYFDCIYRFCRAYISEKVLPNTLCHCIHHFGGHLKNGGHSQSNTTYLGKYETENRYSSIYIISFMPNIIGYLGKTDRSKQNI